MPHNNTGVILFLMNKTTKIKFKSADNKRKKNCVQLITVFIYKKKKECAKKFTLK